MTEMLFEVRSLLPLSSAMVHSYHMIENRHFRKRYPFHALKKYRGHLQDFETRGRVSPSVGDAHAYISATEGGGHNYAVSDYSNRTVRNSIV